MSETSERDKLDYMPLLLECPHLTNGDVRSFEGFVESKKPASYLPYQLSEYQYYSLLEAAKSYVPDAALFKNTSINHYMIYSPSAIKLRVANEVDIARWLGIDNDSLNTILEKSISDDLVEGFLFGFPESALRTWKRFSEMPKQMPKFNELFLGIDKSSVFLKHWISEDIEILRRISHRYKAALEHGGDAHVFVNLPFIRRELERFYKKYFNLDDTDLAFLFSLKSVKRDKMNYLDSDLVQTEIDNTRQQVSDVAS